MYVVCDKIRFGQLFLYAIDCGKDNLPLRSVCMQKQYRFDTSPERRLKKPLEIADVVNLNMLKRATLGLSERRISSTSRVVGHGVLRERQFYQDIEVTLRTNEEHLGSTGDIRKHDTTKLEKRSELTETPFRRQIRPVRPNNNGCAPFERCREVRRWGTRLVFKMRHYRCYINQSAGPSFPHR